MSNTPRTDAKLVSFVPDGEDPSIFNNGIGKDWYFVQMVEHAKEMERLSARPEEGGIAKALIEANDWLRCGEGVDLTYYFPRDCEEKRLIEKIIRGSRDIGAGK